MTYAVYTGTCTYLLDDEGICRWALTPGGHPMPQTDRCVGAQFVACLDLRVEGGLVGELVVGACALFVHREHGRLVLLRTAAIEHVEYRADTDAPVEEATPIYAADPHAHAVPDEHTMPLPEMGGYGPPTRPFPMFTLPGDLGDVLDRPAGEPDPEPLDAEDLLSISVTEVTVSLPLYRAEPPPPAPAPPQAVQEHVLALGPPGRDAPPRPRSVIGPGRRLR